MAGLHVYVEAKGTVILSISGAVTNIFFLSAAPAPGGTTLGGGSWNEAGQIGPVTQVLSSQV